MTMYARAEIDFSTFPDSDGEPMAETFANAIQMVDLQWALRELFARQGRRRVAVGGNQLMYYNPHNGREHVSPDVYVILDRDSPPPPKWQTWIEGKFPDIVFEISSASTLTEDIGAGQEHKPALYQRLGVQEYYVYDPQGDVQPAFRGYGWKEEEWVCRELLASGGMWSPLLGAELQPLPLGESPSRPAGVWLRVLDPVTGDPIPLADEQVLQEQHARMAAENRAQDAEDQARQAAERAARAEQRLAALLQTLREQGIDPD